MKNKIIRLLIATLIVVGFLLIAIGISILAFIISKAIGFNVGYILMPLLIAWAIWRVYGIIDKDKDKDNQ
jgi:predicted membrane metal-binding protein